MKVAYPVVSEAEFPHGLRCGECGREIRPGQPYQTALESFSGAVPVTIIGCVYCP